LDLRRSVLRPPREAILRFDPPGRTGRKKVWLVVIENPADESSYWVFYDPDDGAFGLATKGLGDEFHHIGTYGTLWDTLEGM